MSRAYKTRRDGQIMDEETRKTGSRSRAHKMQSAIPPGREMPDVTEQSNGRKPAGVPQEEATRRLETFYRLTRVLIENDNDIDGLAHAVALLTAEIPGDTSMITLLNRDNELLHIAALHDRDPKADALLQSALRAAPHLPRDKGVLARVINTGQPSLIPSVSSEAVRALGFPMFADFLEQAGVESALIVPIRGRSGMLGAITLGRHRGGKPYTGTDQSFVLELAYRVGRAIDTTLLVDSLRRELVTRLPEKRAVHASHERFRAIFESTTFGVKVMDLVGIMLQVNPAFQAMTGFSETELVGRHFDDVIHAADAPRAFRVFTDLKMSQEPQARFEHRLMRKDGTIIWVRTTFAGVKKGGGDDSVAFIVGIVENITEQKQVELEVVELKDHLQTSIEHERLRLAQDLHDGPLQELYSVLYRLGDLRGRAGGAWDSELRTLSTDIEKTIGALRAAAKELRPPAISNFGLEKAIRSYLDDFQEKHPHIHLHLSLTQDHQLLPENARLTLFRVFQQALMNVVRHSDATEVQIRFAFDAEEAILEVTDNGRGFEVPPNWIRLVRQGHYGLAGLEERVRAAGGVLMVESQPAVATTVRAIIPWSSASNN